MPTPQPPLSDIPSAHDPLHVLRTTKPVVERAALVRLDQAALDTLAADLVDDPVPPPEWDATLHYRDGAAQTAGWVLALDALNFCFWGQDPANPDHRWRVEVEDVVHQGYWALAAALTRAARQGFPIWNATYLAEIPESDVRAILRPADRPDAAEIPLFAQRVANLRELGNNLLTRFDTGLEPPAVELIRRAEGSAARLVQLVVESFPSFDDTATYPGLVEPVRLYKRAQILAADLHGAFDGQDLGRFDDLASLTAFADYKVPQVLRALGVLVYDPRLADRVANLETIPAGSPAEVEIRAATVWACELLRQSLTARGRSLRAFEIDWLLWSAGQSLSPDVPPYHRTPTIFY